MKIRPYGPGDCAGLAKLFYDTVHSVCAADYPPRQLDAWAAGDLDLEAWNDSFLTHHTVVAEKDGMLLGFGDMDCSGYLDRLYVHRDHQRQGVATAICDALEQASAAEKFVTHASITAKPFFEHRGYTAVREQQVERRGAMLTNFVMEKPGKDVLAAMEQEMLDVVDEKGVPTGEIVPRDKAHGEGIRHRTSHVWLVRERDGNIQILLQKRCLQKDSWPGCYDISSAGHIPAGVDFVPSALRELKEELGVQAAPEELIFCGNRSICADGEFHGRPFHDRQYSRVFALRRDREERDFVLQKEEIDSVRWMELEACIQAVKNNTIPHCIYPEELEMVRAAVEKK
ncbi:MAG: GNAT family N-acetyltransferase [Faecousia sp.]